MTPMLRFLYATPCAQQPTFDIYISKGSCGQLLAIVAFGSLREKNTIFVFFGLKFSLQIQRKTINFSLSNLPGPACSLPVPPESALRGNFPRSFSQWQIAPIPMVSISSTRQPCFFSFSNLWEPIFITDKSL